MSAPKTLAVGKLAEKLTDVELALSRLRKTRMAMLSARDLVARALHYGFLARGDDCSFSAIYTDGFDVLAHLSERAYYEAHDVERAFLEAVKGDEVVGPALDAMHSKTPLGEVWSGEIYPDPV